MLIMIMTVMATVIVIVVRIIVVPMTGNAVSGALFHRAVDITMQHAHRQPRENAEHG